VFSALVMCPSIAPHPLVVIILTLYALLGTSPKQIHIVRFITNKGGEFGSPPRLLGLADEAVVVAHHQLGLELAEGIHHHTDHDDER
jgi:hypothetical protein